MPTSHIPDAQHAYASLLAQLRGVPLNGLRPVGIHSGGVWLARRLARDLGLEEPVGSLDISFYRDDYDRIGLHAEVKPTSLGFEVAGASILLVDDVLYTGRTIRGAMNVLFDYGRPARIELAALVDRGGRQLPIAARFVGAAVTLPEDQSLVLGIENPSTVDERFVFTLEPLDS